MTIAITQYSGVSITGSILRVGGTAGTDVVSVVGDKLRVKLIATDVDRGFIDFVRVGK